MKIVPQVTVHRIVSIDAPVAAEAPSIHTGSQPARPSIDLDPRDLPAALFGHIERPRAAPVALLGGQPAQPEVETRLAMEVLIEHLASGGFSRREEQALVALDDAMHAVQTLSESLTGLDAAARTNLERRVFAPLAEVMAIAARQLDEPSRGAPTVPAIQPTPCAVEELTSSGGTTGLFGGNVETATPYVLTAGSTTAALHTDKGIRKYNWNEDAAALFADRRGRFFAGVFDQAGGEGSTATELGGGSRVAALAFLEAVKDHCASAQPTLEGAVAALSQGVYEAHAELLRRGFNEVTTYSAVILDGDQARVVNTGDSGAMQFGADGRFKAESPTHNMPPPFEHFLTECLGSAAAPKVEVTHLQVAPGDYIVLGSDGLLDNQLEPEEIGELLVRAASAEAATVALRDLVRQRMKDTDSYPDGMRPKPDNLALVVIRVG